MVMSADGDVKDIRDTAGAYVGELRGWGALRWLGQQRRRTRGTSVVNCRVTQFVCTNIIQSPQPLSSPTYALPVSLLAH